MQLATTKKKIRRKKKSQDLIDNKWPVNSKTYYFYLRKIWKKDGSKLHCFINSFFKKIRMSSKDRTKCEFPKVDVGNFTLAAMFIDKGAYLCILRPYFRETQIGLKSLQMPKKKKKKSTDVCYPGNIPVTHTGTDSDTFLSPRATPGRSSSHWERRGELLAQQQRQIIP